MTDAAGSTHGRGGHVPRARRRHWARVLAGLFLPLLLAAGAAGCRDGGHGARTGAAGSPAPAGDPGAVPRPRHVVLVVEENREYAQIIGNEAAPWINRLAREGALFTRSHAVAHPSQPNYLALFAGSTFGVDSDDCPLALDGPNLGSALIAAGHTFATYAEGLPQTGWEGCRSGAYVRKHDPAANWIGRGLPAAVIRPMRDFPTDFDHLPAVALVIPDQDNDMHDGGIAEGDRWLERHLDAYVTWAREHESLFILTWDEDDYRHDDNHVATVFAGAGVEPGRYAEPVDHYAVLRTLEAMYGLPLLGESARADPITSIWRRPRRR